MEIFLGTILIHLLFIFSVGKEPPPICDKVSSTFISAASFKLLNFSYNFFALSSISFMSFVINESTGMFFMAFSSFKYSWKIISKTVAVNLSILKALVKGFFFILSIYFFFPTIIPA